MKVIVTVREFDTIIAALRLWQILGMNVVSHNDGLADIAEEHGHALSIEDVDALIERINGGQQAFN